MSKYTTFFMDLDGTITDSGHAIMSSAQYALTSLGYGEQPPELLRKFVGPSLMDSYQNLLGMSQEEATKAVSLYRSVYEAGKMFEVTVYPGIPEILKNNKKLGYQTVLVTSKPHLFASQIMEKLGLSSYFDGICGPEMSDPSSEKVRLIQKAMREFSCKQAECIMIGDTRFDIDGANKAGIDSVGVTYGYGSRQELTDHKATYIVHDLLQWFQEKIWS